MAAREQRHQHGFDGASLSDVHAANLGAHGSEPIARRLNLVYLEGYH